MKQGKMMTRKTHDSQQWFRITKTIDTVDVEPEKRFTHRNYHRCPHDDAEWIDEWSCACNDRCPVCRAEIEPYLTEDVI
jgi:hypothetical protein